MIILNISNYYGHNLSYIFFVESPGHLHSFASAPDIAATIEGAPKIAAIPAATPIIKPQDTLPVKNPIPTEIIANAANALPPVPVAMSKTLHITSENLFFSIELLADALGAPEAPVFADAYVDAKKIIERDKRHINMFDFRLNVFIFINIVLEINNLKRILNISIYAKRY